VFRRGININRIVAIHPLNDIVLHICLKLSPLIIPNEDINVYMIKAASIVLTI
jgi:hypothetical protein